jgi:hypothetical protein
MNGAIQCFSLMLECEVHILMMMATIILGLGVEEFIF